MVTGSEPVPQGAKSESVGVGYLSSASTCSLMGYTNLPTTHIHAYRHTPYIQIELEACPGYTGRLSLKQNNTRVDSYGLYLQMGVEEGKLAA